ncbi:MAG: nucleoside-diphosphate kinase [Spiroplasmataceae bacterium]|jgi:nucleoside-diphosphate kinase|nr:nucleoside-diphosphate kinase [Spiroplasmataceae bacterium]
MNLERTLSIIKPDITKKNLNGEVINFLEKKGFKIIGMKMIKMTPGLAKEFYQEHQARSFFPEMIEFISNSPVIVICLERENAIKFNREIMGVTNPQDAQEGTIRKIYGTNIDNNAVHGSDSSQSAEREINLFFKKEEIF